jgi:hypothetical protein
LAWIEAFDSIPLIGIVENAGARSIAAPGRRAALACTALDHCQRRAAGEPADEAGEDQLIEFAGNYGLSLDWIVLGDLDPTIRRLSAIGHDDDHPAVMVA